MTYLRFVLGLGGLALTGCGLISSDVTNVDLTLPDKSFTIDTTSWQVDPDMTMALLAMDCSAAPSVCGTAAQHACSMGCTGACSATTHTCDLDLSVSLYQPVNLLMERPDLKSIADQSVVNVSVDTVTYEVTSNTLSVDTPTLEMFIAPMSVTDPKDPMATKIAEIPMVLAGTTTSGPTPVDFTSSGRADLQSIMATFKTPFNVLVGTSIEVTSASEVPTGKLDAVIHVIAHAGL